VLPPGAWTCAWGHIGAAQNANSGDRTTWSGTVLQEASSHRYRAFYVPYMIQKAKQLDILSAEGWFIDEFGRACVQNTLTFTFELAVR
jgi:hypothetical protein